MPTNAIVRAMKDLNGSFIFAVCLLAFTALVFFFKYGEQRLHSSALEKERIASETVAINLEKEVERRIQITEEAEKVARKNMERAEQARKMLESARKESELSQKELLDSLNSQLEREAEARLAAENASKELAVQRDILSKTADETRKSLEKLQAQKQDSNAAEIKRMQKLLAEKEKEIEALKLRQAELERMRIQAEAAQRKTEAEIIDKGGQVSLPKHKRILSPNIRSGR